MIHDNICANVLLDYAMNYLNNNDVVLTDEKAELCKNVFNRYTRFQISYENALELLKNDTDLINVLEKLKMILKCKNEEPPPPPTEDSESSSSSRKKTRMWAYNEDNRLLCGVFLFGQDNWLSVAHFVGGGRTRSQCSQRWIRVIDPKICKLPWTEEEDALLLKLIKEYGKKSWMKVSNGINNRTDVQCRYRYSQLKKNDRIPNDKEIERPLPNIKKEPTVENHREKINPIFSDNVETFPFTTDYKLQTKVDKFYSDVFKNENPKGDFNGVNSSHEEDGLFSSIPFSSIYELFKTEECYHDSYWLD